MQLRGPWLYGDSATMEMNYDSSYCQLDIIEANSCLK